MIAVAAFALPPLAGRMQLPAVVLEILFGIAVGPVLGWVHANDFISALGELGFLLLLFLAGFEIDVGVFERSGMRPALRASLIFVLTLLVAGAAAVALNEGIFMTLVLATTSVGLIVPTLRAGRSLGSGLGQDILLAAVIADFATLLIISLVALVIHVGVGLQLLAFPLLLVLVPLSFGGLRTLAWWWPERFARLFDAHDPDALGVRFAIATLLAYVGLASALGIEPALGAFLAGTGTATVFRNRGQLDRTLDGLGYGFLIPIFFIGVGLDFSLSGFDTLAAVGFILLLLVTAFVVKLIPALLVLAGRHGVRAAASAGLLLSARLSLIIVAARVGLELGVISPDLESQIILLAALTAMLAPIGYRLVAGGGGRTSLQTAASATVP